jgi:hypothetical protein
MTDTSMELIVPTTGEVVNLDDPMSVVSALTEIRDLESRLREIKGVLTDAIVAESRRQGTKTIVLPDGRKAEVKGGEDTEWDHVALEHRLRSLGMPETRIREIVVEEVSYRVDTVKAKQAARANHEYAEAVEEFGKVRERRPSISIRRP